GGPGPRRGRGGAPGPGGAAGSGPPANGRRWARVGRARPPPIGGDQTRRGPPAGQRSGSGGACQVPSPRGPRQRGQSSATTEETNRPATRGTANRGKGIHPPSRSTRAQPVYTA